MISVEIHVETEKCVENIITNILKADKPISSFEQIQRDIIFNQYGDKISAGFEAVLGFPVEVQIITQENLADYQVEARLHPIHALSQRISQDSPLR